MAFDRFDRQSVVRVDVQGQERSGPFDGQSRPSRTAEEAGHLRIRIREVDRLRPFAPSAQ